jgi:Mrp family chromosome partitioning ATPase
MEKLQQALQKARQQRDGDAPPRRGPQETSRETATSGGSRADELWAALPGFSPDPARLRRNRVVSFAPGRASAEMDVLRTKTLLHMRRNGWRRLAVTSATAGCGKSTVLANLALGMTRQPDLRTILFDYDLHHPSIGAIIGAEPAHDVTALLTGEVAFEEQALRIRDNLAVCLAKTRAQDPMRHLMSAEGLARLEEIERRYKPDLMLFDLPPLVIGGDTPGFLANVDCALIVARAERSTVPDIDSCEREVAENTNVLGLVLNQCRLGEFGPRYGYGDAY